MRILGVSAFYHDSAAALIANDHIVAAAQEERFTRVKYDLSFPRNAIAYCIGASGRTLADVDHVVFYEKPFVKFERLLETYLAFAPRGFTSFRTAIPIWIKQKLLQKKLLIDELATLAPEVDWGSRLLFSEHHLSHAASAFYPSPFEEAAILTMDGVESGRPAPLAWGAAPTSSSLKRCVSPIRSACSIRPLPTTQGSRSIPANTS